jgi:hypothetical protein
MEGWHLLVGGLAVLGVVAALYGLDRLGLWLEDRGWLYYRRKKPSSSPASCWVAMQRLVEPGVKHVAHVGQERHGEDAEAKKERVMAALLACLDATPVNKEEVRLCLTAARRQGLDWRGLYEEAVRLQRSARPDLAPGLPSPDDVAPPE